jgi:hypothetical protein
VIAYLGLRKLTTRPDGAGHKEKEAKIGTLLGTPFGAHGKLGGSADGVAVARRPTTH